VSSRRRPQLHVRLLQRDQWRRLDLVPGGAHAKVTGFLQEATVDI